MRAVILLVLVCFGMAMAQNADFYCGRRLATALAYLCDGNLVKRSVEMEEMWPWRGRNKRDGIIAECCEQPCTTRVLLSYCAA
ncbi:bombyxin A-2 homolog [Aricia agestis]|uniref:bombyxin A-2 homolog n=1 Tax=Aricia agestis TaxID=91739 RepID=UPI001C2081DC|nr:bombyxin A-2 homolog [Aricia agestis]